MSKSTALTVGPSAMPVLLGIKRELDRLENEFVEVGHKLWAVQASREWGDHGYANFREALEAAGLEYRKSCYLIDVAKAMQVSKLPEAEAHEIGWTKMAVIAKKLGQGRKSDKIWIEHARTCTTEVLKQVVKGLKPDASKMLNVLLTPVQRQLAKKVMSFANGGDMPRGTLVRGRILTGIFADYAKIKKIRLKTRA